MLKVYEPPYYHVLGEAEWSAWWRRVATCLPLADVV
jgi:hypothetical protein